MPDGHIFLIGYMAAGKTTFGKALAKAYRRRFIDLDDYISDKAGMSVSEIFAQHGEEVFRDMERRALAGLADNLSDPLIVACGGGTPCFGDNMAIMSNSGMTVWLDTSCEVILRRLRDNRDGRPLVASLDGGGELENYVAENLERRRPFYSRAKIRFDSSHLESEAEISESVASFIRLTSVFE